MFSANASQVSNDVKYIEDFCSVYLRTGTGASQTVTTGVKENTGALVISKSRSAATDWAWYDTFRGATYDLVSNSTAAQTTQSQGLTAFNADGHTWGTLAKINTSGATYVDTVLKPTPKFFDVVTYTGNGTAGRTVAHNLGSVPGSIIVKSTSSLTNWHVYHRSLAVNQNLLLDLTQAARTDNSFNSTAPTATVFSLGGGATNTNGETYVAYLFAHNAGGFGLTGTDNVISCGSFTTDASGAASVTLGYEPQWVLLKKTSTGAEDWYLFDNMRGIPTGSADAQLNPNLSAAETSSFDYINLSATGFNVLNQSSSATYIYIAIRRGPMKVPTDGTSVFIPVSATPSGATTVTTNFPVDLAINAQRDSGTSGNKVFWDRLRGSSTAAGQGVFSNLTNAEVSYSGNGIGLQSNTTIVDNFWNTLNGATTPVIYWNFKRAPSFFDEVCYTGTGVTHTEAHNLGVAPELIIVKRRASATASWAVYAAPLTASYVGFLDLTNAFQADNMWNSTAPTSTAFTVRAANAQVNATGSTYVAYLFATCPGISKVGSYTGTGTTQTINCGFTGGARFVLIKRTDSTGDWYVWDTARGIVTANDPHLSLNTTAAEVTTDDTIDTDSTGFIVNQVTATNVNVSSATYIYLAIA